MLGMTIKNKNKTLKNVELSFLNVRRVWQPCKLCTALMVMCDCQSIYERTDC